MDSKEIKNNRKKEEISIELQEQLADNTRKEIKENYKIGIEYYQDIEEHQD